MLAIGNTLISEELLEKHFVCDLNACKGACCVKGDYGAPLENDELEELDKVYDIVKPYLPETGIVVETRPLMTVPLPVPIGVSALLGIESTVTPCGIL